MSSAGHVNIGFFRSRRRLMLRAGAKRNPLRTHSNPLKLSGYRRYGSATGVWGEQSHLFTIINEAIVSVARCDHLSGLARLTR